MTGYRVVVLSCDRRPGGEICPAKLVTVRSTMDAAREDASWPDGSHRPHPLEWSTTARSTYPRSHSP